MPSVPTTSLDLTGADVVADPYPHFAVERERHPVGHRPVCGALAEQRPRQLAAARAHESGDADDLHPRPLRLLRSELDPLSDRIGPGPESLDHRAIFTADTNAQLNFR